MNKKLLLLSILCLHIGLFQTTLAQTELVKDINPDGGWSNIDYLFEIGNVVYFTARDGADIELWRSDGTEAGTHVVKEINPGSDSANPQNFTALNGNWIFTADDGTLGVELWITDGTEAGTFLLKDINPTFFSSSPTNLTKVGNSIFFTATTESGGNELWVTDGTSAGTQLVLDIEIGTDGSTPIELTDVNGTLFFSANTSGLGYELWQSDGTAVGTQLVKDIMPGMNSSSPTHLTNVDGKLFFSADDGVNGRELWQSDGTEAGTVLVDDIMPGAGNASPEKLTAIGNKLFFTADDGVNGLEFWWTDGSATMPNLMLENIYPGQDSSSPASFFAGNNLLYFIASDGMSSQELWRSDGTVGGTFLLKDINPGFNSSNIKIYAEVGNTLYFEAYEAVHGVELWKTDGTPENTVLVEDINPGAEFSNPLNFVVNGNDLYFTAFETEKLWQVWRTNPLTNETFVVTELPSELFNGGLYKPEYIKRNADTIFVVRFGTGFGEEYYRYTPEPFTLDTFFTNSPLTCNGDETGTISLGISGGLGLTNQFTYQWSEAGLTGSSLSNLSAGTYTVTITDCGGNTIVGTTTIEEPAGLQLDNLGVADAICFGEASGMIDFSVVGGTPDYTYTWSNNATTSTLSDIAAGNYNLTVTDQNNCTLEESFSIDEPSEIMIATQEVTAVSCFGLSDGEAMASLTGGNGPYNFFWENGMTTATASNLSSGTHVVTVTDATGCTQSASAEITQPTQLLATATEDTPAACGGGSTGGASVMADGGTGTYSYLWDNNETTSSAIGLTAGAHSVTVTDANNCTTIAMVDVSEVSNFISAVDTDNVSCLGATDGQATISVTGDSNDYNFIWDDGTTTASNSDLEIGNYMVTVTNTINNCEQIQIVVITGASASVAIDNQVSCFGFTDGQATVAIANGQGNYSYLWSNNETNATANNLAMGSNTVTVTDDNNCSISLVVDITQPDELTGMTTLIDGLDCFGDADAEASVQAAGGTADYSYLWDTGATNAAANNLDGGTHTVTITDANNCTTTANIDIVEPDELSLTGSSTDATGNNADGTASVTASGGTGDYTYAWNTNPVQNTASISDLVAGDYEVTVTDDNGCMETLVVTVDMTVGLSNITGLEDFQILPNPTKGKTTVRLSFNHLQDIELRLYDPMGRILRYRSTSVGASAEFVFDLSDLADGLYYLRLTADGEETYRKIVLTKS